MTASIIIQIVSAIPTIVKAVEAILSSDAGKTIEQAITEVIHHNTPGQPNSPSLS
jgi:hypothetical protein